MRNFMVKYFLLWGDIDPFSSSMRRILPVIPASFPPIGSKLNNVTIPYFAVDVFEWIRDPSFTLTPQQIFALTGLPTDAPQEMEGERWGLIPNGQWGQYDEVLPAPHSVTESRIFVITSGSRCNDHIPSTVPPDILQILLPNVYGSGLPGCFIFANVTYRAGAAHCRQCQVYGPGKVKDYGDFKDLKLIDHQLTTVALAIAPYLAITIKGTARAMPSFPTLQNQTIEHLSRSYQLAWGGIKHSFDDWKWGAVQIAVDATVASVTIWRVAVWGCFQATLLILGVLFRHLNMRGDRQWIGNLSFIALLVDPTPLHCDMEKFAEDTSDIQVAHKLERNTENPEYIIITQSRRPKADSGSIDSAIGDKLRGTHFFPSSSATDSSVLALLANRKDIREGYNNEAWDSRHSNLISPFKDDRTSSLVGHTVPFQSIRPSPVPPDFF